MHLKISIKQIGPKNDEKLYKNNPEKIVLLRFKNPEQKFKNGINFVHFS